MYNIVTTPSSELRRDAREALRGRWKVGVLSTFTFVIVQFVINLISSYITIKSHSNGLLNILFSIVGLVIMAPITIGYMGVCLKLSRHESAAPDDVFQGFQITGRAVGLQILLNIYTSLWMLLFILPGMIFMLMGINSTFFVLLGWAIIIAGIVVGIIKYISYCMSYYIVLDNPSRTANDAISESKKIMKGNKSKYFWLQLSFIGWTLLISVITILLTFMMLGDLSFKAVTNLTVGTLSSITGVGFVYSLIINIISMIPLLFLQPYIMVSVAGFYNRIVTIFDPTADDVNTDNLLTGQGQNGQEGQSFDKDMYRK